MTQNYQPLLPAGNTPILMTTGQLLAVVGFDEMGEQTVLAVCLPSQLKQAAMLIFSTYHQTTVIEIYDLQLGMQPKARYTQKEIARFLL